MNTLILLVVFAVMVCMNVPVAVCLGMAALVFLLVTPDYSISVIPTLIFGGIDSFPLMAIPFFIMAGDMMRRSGVLPGLVALADSLVGHLRGGLAYVNIVSSMFFSGVTGVAVADTAAIGTMLIPPMIQQGYRPAFCAAVTAASSMMGPIIPPSVAMIIYANVFGGGISVAKLFLLGIVPGCLLGFGMMILVFAFARWFGVPPVSTGRSFSLERVFRQLWKALPGLMVPVIILGGIIGGVFTPTEAGAIAVAYAMLVGILTGNLSLRDVADSLVESCKISSVVYLLLATAKLVSFILASQQIPQLVAEAFLSWTASPYIFLLLTVLFLLSLGFVMEAVATMIMLVPVLGPAALSYGIDPHIFGLVVVMTVQAALITPPVALGLFIACPIAKCKIEEATKYIWPFLVLMFSVIMLVGCVPGITLWLVDLFGI
ncbi:TRAP transporter large permease [Thermodesulforhabdus norvegica]|uniref:TRAP transporter, DctM subunit n=1 Tax=Thermodesulforhabdus norvegica TaxID=39841 RepID=A0A1I4R320_9BACT|nr:TRAP transporter large permease [Thermodesulforhabdus norvegica]SFM46702.1 TRAP transporter, DctM subunit [Thermodesulforhabdus norvegica]